jgi:glutamate formiminotransferase/formiminotetrahydrofolate cyclodeaminase
MSALVECVPNFSEGRDRAVIDAIGQAIGSVSGVKLLDVDPGADTNRTVYTFVGEPQAVSEAAFRAAARAVELIDMTRHRGAHPRLGSMDVCPFVPVAGVTMADCVDLARALGRRIGDELRVPVYFYEHAATADDRRSLASIRAGEYEGLSRRLADPRWRPDAGPAAFNARAGAFVVGAREFLIAYNVNLNTTDRRLAHEIALTIREAGRLRRDASGTVLVDEHGNQLRAPGRLAAVRALGWYIDEYRQAQVSINLLDYHTTPLHVVFETVREEADRAGLLVTGSELVGVTPLEPLLAAGRHFLQKQRKSPAASQRELVGMAVRSLGLSQLSPFDPDKKIIEYQVRGRGVLASLPLHHFVDDVASETPTPGGGSVAAAVGALAAALAAMVANLTVGRKGVEPAWDRASALAERAQAVKDALVDAIDADTAAFNQVLTATRMPRGSADQDRTRADALEQAWRAATRVPLKTARLSADAASLAADTVDLGHRPSASDAGVAASMARAAAEGAALNVLINVGSITDAAVRRECEEGAAEAVARARAACSRTFARLNGLLETPATWLPS